MLIVQASKPAFEKVIEHLQHAVGSLRTGRASPALVDGIGVEAYGSVQPVKALASMSTPDARTLVIEPWDNSVVKAIESAIVAAGIGVAPVVDGKIIRLIMPMMTEENRQKMVKVLHERLEDAKIQLRQVREDSKKTIEKQTGVGQDDIRHELESLDKTVKEYVDAVHDLGNKKEAEIMTV